MPATSCSASTLVCQLRAWAMASNSVGSMFSVEYGFSTAKNSVAAASAAARIGAALSEARSSTMGTRGNR